MKKIPEYFDPNKLIVEILEDVSWTGDLIDVCRQLKKKGFSIALDDVTSLEHTNVQELLTYVDIIKVDIRQTSCQNRAEINEIVKGKSITLLAEKVETVDEHLQCVREGFELFQGYYYSRPVVISAVDLPIYSTAYFQVLKELAVKDDQINKDKVIKIFEGDLALTYKLLRLINFSCQLSEPVQSIKQAVMILGFEPLRKWLYVFSVKEGGPGPASQEAMKLSLQRAKMCEQIGISLGHNRLGEEYFLTGLMSSIDEIMQRPKNEVIESLPLDFEIKRALNHEENTHRFILDLVIAVEKADFDLIEPQIHDIKLSVSKLLEIYGQAIAWTEQLYNDHFASAEEIK
ncbi:EAL and HDOD domain-containing protein [Halobacillus seohaensis]|uniref:EAL and HDOD domain-containing protein n=1 Tax=Halobacillus seohaensis TaxID=447421 RepID=A0ABW2EQS2_9BACI